MAKTAGRGEGHQKPTQSRANSGLHGRSEYWGGWGGCPPTAEEYNSTNTKLGLKLGIGMKKNSTNHRSLKSGQISQYLETTLMNRLTHLCRPFPSVSGILRTKSLALTAHLKVATDKFLAQHVSKLISLPRLSTREDAVPVVTQLLFLHLPGAILGMLAQWVEGMFWKPLLYWGD